MKNSFYGGWPDGAPNPCLADLNALRDWSVRRASVRDEGTDPWRRPGSQQIESVVELGECVVIIRHMFDLLSAVGSALVGDVIKRVIASGLEWAKGQPKPVPEKVEKKVENLVAEHIPASVPPDMRAEVISAVTQLAMPTFAEIVQYSPNTSRIISAAKRAPAKKAAKKAWKKSTKTPAKKATKRTAKKR